MGAIRIRPARHRLGADARVRAVLIMHLRADWNYPTSVRFGPGRIGELPDAVKAAGLARPLFVTDPNLARLPMVANALASLRTAGIPTELFSDIRPNPVEANITA